MLKLALPNGSLEKKTLELLAACGIEIKRSDRQAICPVTHPIVASVFFTRPIAIPRLVSKGLCDIGICGEDCQAEYESLVDRRKNLTLAKLSYSKKSSKPTRIALCAKKGAAETIKGAVYTEYPGLTRRYLGGRGLYAGTVEIVASPGSTEGHIALGEYNFGVCVVEEGQTMEVNGLKIIDVIMESETTLIARPNIVDDTTKFPSVV